MTPTQSADLAGRLEKLSEAELTLLRWCAEINPQKVGFLGPSVRKHGPIAEYARAVDFGLVTLEQAAGRPVEVMGYWITDLGRAALRHQHTGSGDGEGR